MAIELNKVAIDIDGKKYQFYKLNFGFKRKLVELQTNLRKLQNEIAKEHGIEVDDINISEKVSEDQKLEIASVGTQIQGALVELFVNKEEADIIDAFDETNLGELIEALK